MYYISRLVTYMSRAWMNNFMLTCMWCQENTENVMTPSPRNAERIAESVSPNSRPPQWSIGLIFKVHTHTNAPQTGTWRQTSGIASRIARWSAASVDILPVQPFASTSRPVYYHSHTHQHLGGLLHTTTSEIKWNRGVTIWQISDQSNQQNVGLSATTLH